MKKGRVWLAAAAALLLAHAAWAATLSVPSQVPESASWGVSIDTGAPDFDRLVLYLDGERMASLYVFDRDDVLARIDDARVVRAAYKNGVFLATFAGLSAGAYTVSFKAFAGDTVRDEDEKTVNIYPALDRREAEEKIQRLQDALTASQQALESRVAEARQAMEQRVDRVAGSLDELDRALSDLEASLQALEARASSQDEALSRQLETVRQAITRVSRELNTVKDETRQLSSLREELKALDASLASLEAEVNTPDPQFVGLVNFSQNALLGLMVLIFIALLATAYFGLRPAPEQRETLFSVPAPPQEEAPKEPASGGGLVAALASLWPSGKRQETKGLAAFGESSGKKEEEGTEGGDKEEEGEEEDEEEKDKEGPAIKTRGKWAFDPSRKPARPLKEPRSETGFNLGELIRKNERP